MAEQPLQGLASLGALEATKTMYSTVIVPLDGSQFAEGALHVAEAVAARCHATLLLVRVHDTAPHLEYHPATWDDFVRGEEDAYLERLATSALAHRVGDVEWRVLDGPVAPALCACAESSREPLLVMSTHGRTGIRRSWLGSVADAVARHTIAPVLMVRTSHDQPRPTEGDSGFANVVVGLDGSAHGERALAHGMRVAVAFGAKLVLLRVVTPVAAVGPYGAPHAPWREPELREPLVREVYEYMRDVASRCLEEQPSLTLHVDIRIAETAGGVILERARALSRPLVVLGSHGRGVSRFFFGSVADDVIRGAPAAVLLIRPPSISVSPTESSLVPASVTKVRDLP